MSGFNEVIDGVLHWEARHPRIKQVVHSYYLPFQRLVIDPILSPDLIDDLRRQGGVERVVLTNRHHYRDSALLIEAFRCDVLAPESGMHEFDSDDGVKPYRWGEEIASGVTAHEVAAICPDDGALHITTGPGALAFADGVIEWEGGLAFVPDFLMDEPETVKAKQIEAMKGFLDLEFEALLLAHGAPITSGGKAAVERFIESPAQAEFDL